jgi:hypothetical protein
MRLLFLTLVFSFSCNDSGGGGQPDMAKGSGGFICPAHPENCQGMCCGSTCLNTSIDINNCGGCNAKCSGGTVCMGGHCGCLPSGAPCSMTQTCCPNAGCADLMTDLRNCGTCGHSCGDGSTCVGGVCKCGNTTCTGTQVCCSGACADTCSISMPDMAMSGGMPLCDCSMLDPDPLGQGMTNQCPLTNQCVGNGCCLEDQASPFGPPAGTCVDMTPCQTSTTPQ